MLPPRTQPIESVISTRRYQTIVGVGGGVGGCRQKPRWVNSLGVCISFGSLQKMWCLCCFSKCDFHEHRPTPQTRSCTNISYVVGVPPFPCSGVVGITFEYVPNVMGEHDKEVNKQMCPHLPSKNPWWLVCPPLLACYARIPCFVLHIHGSVTGSDTANEVTPPQDD